MTTKEKLKREIDKMPNDLLEKVYNYIKTLRSKTTQKKEDSYF